MDKPFLTRRDFLRFSAVGLGAAVLSACGVQPSPTSAPIQPTAASSEQARALVGDVLDFALKGDWQGRFGFVKFKLNAAWYNGDKAYFIRTDASDSAYAQTNKLVYAPLLNAADRAKDAAGNLYFFDGGAPNQLPALNSVPGQANYSSLWRVNKVKPKSATTVYDSEQKIKAAAAAGEVSIESTSVYVNHPVVKWPGGEMTLDSEKKEYLGGGQLLAPVDVAGMTVTFKLHECFPGSRYIVTDTSAVPMAPMMKVSPASPTQKLVGDNFSGVDLIWVFANGIKGSGVMGFQPAIFAHRAGDALWSPYWNHFTLKWKDGKTPRILKSEDAVKAVLATGDVEQFNGTPDTHPQGFVVNCPVPVLAPNTFTGV